MSGFECETAAGEEMRNAQRDVPRSIAASAFVSVGCYLLPIFAILIVMPAGQVSSVAGFMDAVARSFSVYGSAQNVLVDLAALAFIFTLLTQGAAWMMGSDRVLAAVGMDGTFPRALGVISERFGTPVRVNLISGVVATVFSIVAINLASGDSATTFEIVLDDRDLDRAAVLRHHLPVRRAPAAAASGHAAAVPRPRRRRRHLGSARCSRPASSPSGHGSPSSPARSRTCSA